MYAWDDEFDVARCNTFETHVRATTPIGVFPGGETPEDLIDMTGDVWDWTGTLYRAYPYQVDDGREAPEADGRRVLRSGSWVNSRDNARTAYRHHYHPEDRDDDFGFRVLSVSPIR